MSRPLSALALGVVLSVSACGTSSTPADSAASDAASTPAASSTSSAPPTTGGTSSAPSGSSTSAGERDVVADAPSRSWQDAVSAAREEFPAGRVDKIELEPSDDGRLVYKVELLSADTKYAAQYDAETLAKRSAKKDSLGEDAATKQKKVFDPSSVVGLDEAVSAARGAKDGTITAWKIEGKDDGRVQYEFDIRPSGATEDAEVQVDAKDGTVLSNS